MRAPLDALDPALYSRFRTVYPRDEGQDFLRKLGLTAMDGEGVRIIMENSERLSGKRPIYQLLDDAELLLTIQVEFDKRSRR